MYIYVIDTVKGSYVNYVTHIGVEGGKTKRCALSRKEGGLGQR